MWKRPGLFAVPAQVMALVLLLPGTASAQPPGLPDIIDLPDSAPDAITLSGTIRDFMASHPDFEGALGVDPGIVTSTIGPDRKPVYASETTTRTTTGEENFDQWYRNVEDVNLPTEHTISFDRVPDTDPPLYRFADTSFFPIDGELWGNQGRSHNYWFTYELHNSFTYQGGKEFSFTGDDDLWVFINDQLVIDLGGVHAAMSDSVSLDEVADQLGLVEGETYSFDMFFAERHTTQSNFIAETSIILEEPEEPPAEEPPAEEPPAEEPPAEEPPAEEPPAKEPPKGPSGDTGDGGDGDSKAADDNNNQDGDKPAGDDEDQVEVKPDGGVETGDGSSSGADGVGLVLGSVVVMAAGGAAFAARPRRQGV